MHEHNTVEKAGLAFGEQADLRGGPRPHHLQHRLTIEFDDDPVLELDATEEVARFDLDGHEGFLRTARIVGAEARQKSPGMPAPVSVVAMGLLAVSLKWSSITSKCPTF